jgi:hypothetical protein
MDKLLAGMVRVGTEDNERPDRPPAVPKPPLGEVRILDPLPIPAWLVRGRETTTFRLDLPLPPSANDLWRIALQYNRQGICVGGRMVKTDRYTAWWDEAGYGATFPQGWEGFAGIVLLSVDCGAMGRGRDVDNCIKPVQDLCAKMLGVNDSCFRFCAAFESSDHGVATGRVGVTLVMAEEK